MCIISKSDVFYPLTVCVGGGAMAVYFIAFAEFLFIASGCCCLVFFWWLLAQFLMEMWAIESLWAYIIVAVWIVAKIGIIIFFYVTSLADRKSPKSSFSFPLILVVFLSAWVYTVALGHIAKEPFQKKLKKEVGVMNSDFTSRIRLLKSQFYSESSKIQKSANENRIRKWKRHLKNQRYINSHLKANQKKELFEIKRQYRTSIYVTWKTRLIESKTRFQNSLLEIEHAKENLLKKARANLKSKLKVLETERTKALNYIIASPSNYFPFVPPSLIGPQPFVNTNDNKLPTGSNFSFFLFISPWVLLMEVISFFFLKSCAVHFYPEILYCRRARIKLLKARGKLKNQQNQSRIAFHRIKTKRIILQSELDNIVENFTRHKRRLI